MTRPLAPLAARAKVWLGTRPTLFALLYQRLGQSPALLVGRDTEIVIEGFPRSASSYAVHAFQMAQGRPVRSADHLHVPAQVMRGVALGVPTLVLTRNPEDAVRSVVVRHPEQRPRDALRAYATFYETLLPLVDGFVVATFEQVIGDFGGVIRRLNRRFGSSFREFERTMQNEALVRAELIARNFRGTPGYEYLPHPRKEELKRQVSLAGCGPLLTRCAAVHARFRELAIDPAGSPRG